jgi:hypothetical protein
MNIAYENEVWDVIYTSDVGELRFNHAEWIYNKVFESIYVEMLCVIKTLKFIPNNQDLILNRT